jgi:hypothetical protein
MGLPSGGPRRRLGYQLHIRAFFKFLHALVCSDTSLDTAEANINNREWLCSTTSQGLIDKKLLF